MPASPPWSRRGFLFGGVKAAAVLPAAAAGMGAADRAVASAPAVEPCPKGECPTCWPLARQHNLPAPFKIAVPSEDGGHAHSAHSSSMVAACSWCRRRIQGTG